MVSTVFKDLVGPKAQTQLTAAQVPESLDRSSRGCRKRKSPVLVVATANDVSQLP
jgi:hypothetical protein